MTEAHAYRGSPESPYPPLEGPWSHVPATDRAARHRAHALVDALPAYHFVDEARSDGVVRFFAYETALGRTVSAVHLAADGTLGATNPSFVAPTAAQVAANPPGDALADAAVAMLTDFEANGVPSEHASDPFVTAVQTAWNADPLGQANGANGQLAVDGGYGPNVQAAITSIAGSAPAVNTGAAGTTPTPLTGMTTQEPVPSTDATCTAWTVDTSNPQAQAIAASIAFHNTPVSWVDQGDYQTNIGGADYFFVMWWEKGLKAVAAYKCTAGSAAGGGGTTPVVASTTSSSSAGPAVIVGTLVVGALVAVGFAAKRPLRSLYHRHTRA